jgi:hypothetical protein
MFIAMLKCDDRRLVDNIFLYQTINVIVSGFIRK